MEQFLRALQKTEYGNPDADGRFVLKPGDGGRAIGPLQIHKAYFIDAGIKGQYSQCVLWSFSVKVFINYMLRYAPSSLFSNDFQTLARIHNGGPQGAQKESTVKYWDRVSLRLNKLKEIRK